MMPEMVMELGNGIRTNVKAFFSQQQEEEDAKLKANA